jgi:hypothetical protein
MKLSLAWRRKPSTSKSAGMFAAEAVAAAVAPPPAPEPSNRAGVKSAGAALPARAGVLHGRLRGGGLAPAEEPAHGEEDRRAEQQHHHDVGHAFTQAQVREQGGEADAGGEAGQRAHPAAHAGLGGSRGRGGGRCAGGGCRGGRCGGGLGGDGVALHHRRIAADAGALAAAQALGGLGVLDHQAGTHDYGEKCDCDAFHGGSPLIENSCWLNLRLLRLVSWCGLLRLVDGVLRLGRHVVFVVLGQHLGRREAAIGLDAPLGHRAFAFLEQVGQDPGIGDGDILAVSVIMKCTVRLSRRIEPSLTRPPMRKALSCGALPSSTSVGVTKKAMLLFSAFMTRAVATPMVSRPPAIRAMRFCRVFISVSSC